MPYFILTLLDIIIILYYNIVTILKGGKTKMASKIKSVEVATEWWANKISNPTLFSNGANDRANERARIFAFILAKDTSSELSKQKIVNFKEELSNSIESDIETRGYCYLSTDYAPKGKLAAVAEKTHIRGSVFPWKTNMEVPEEYVKASDGNGKKYEMIYSKKNI